MVLGFLTSHALVIWFHLALYAEIFCTSSAAHSILGHMFCHLFRNFLPFFVSSVIIWLRFWLKREGSFTWGTLNQVHTSLLKVHLELFVVETLHKLISERFSQIWRRNHRLTPVAARLSEVAVLLESEQSAWGVLFETAYVELVEAAVWEEHATILGPLVLFAEYYSTVDAGVVIPRLLNLLHLFLFARKHCLLNHWRRLVWLTHLNIWLISCGSRHRHICLRLLILL